MSDIEKQIEKYEFCFDREKIGYGLIDNGSRKMSKLMNKNNLATNSQIDYIDRVILSLLKITGYRATREQVIDYINSDGDELHHIISDRVPFWMQTTAAMDAAQIMADGVVEWDEDRIIKDKKGDHLCM